MTISQSILTFLEMVTGLPLTGRNDKLTDSDARASEDLTSARRDELMPTLSLSKEEQDRLIKAKLPNTRSK